MAALSCSRRETRTSTGMSRNEVAVGMPRLAAMLATAHPRPPPPPPALSNGPRLDTAPGLIGSTQLEVTARKQSYVIHPALVRLGQVKYGLEQAESDACSLRGRGVAPAAAQVRHRS